MFIKFISYDRCQSSLVFLTPEYLCLNMGSIQKLLEKHLKKARNGNTSLQIHGMDLLKRCPGQVFLIQTESVLSSVYEYSV